MPFLEEGNIFPESTLVLYTEPESETYEFQSTINNLIQKWNIIEL